MSKLRYIILVWIVLLAACRPNIVSSQVTIRVDGKDIPLSTNVLTVREALNEASVVVGADDRVLPDLWVELESGMVIKVIRVQEEVLTERELVPYSQQTIKSEALPTGQQKFLQAGKNGQVEVTYRLRFEDGVEVSRSILQRVVIQEPVAQIIAVGVEGVVESVNVQGTIAYLNAGNAWIMRGESGGRHAVTSAGNLDGRVFALSPDGSYLLYSVPTDTAPLDGPFNELYLLNIRLVNEKPVKLTVQNVLWADWSPDGRQIAYSSGVKGSAPGWKANNDLWLVTVFDAQGSVVKSTAERILPPQVSGTYSWWPAQYAWSPDGAKVAYARADEVGWIELKTRRAFPLASFAPLSVVRDEVWTPALSWSPDSLFIVTSIHGAPLPGQTAESSQRFDVWALSPDQQVRARLVDAAGMWATPRWSPRQEGSSWVAYAQAGDPLNSYESRYILWVMDRDGSNRRSLFPVEGQAGLSSPIEYAWSPDGRQMTVLYLGDLYLVNLDGGAVRQLTGDGQNIQLDWGRD